MTWDPYFDGDDLRPQSDRLQILTPEEYELLWGLPQFSSDERDLFFALTPRDKARLSRLRTPRTKAHYLLQLGYFRARQRFFTPDMERMADDLAYVCARYLDGVQVNNLAISLHTRFQHYRWITEVFGYRMLEPEDRVPLEERALRAAKIANRPVYVFRDVVDYLRDRHIVLPGYTYLQDVVRRALAFERDRLATALARAMCSFRRRGLRRRRLCGIEAGPALI